MFEILEKFQPSFLRFKILKCIPKIIKNLPYLNTAISDDIEMKTFFKRTFRRFPLENFEVFKNSNAD